MSASTNQQDDQQKKKKGLPFDYTTTDDIFLTAKGKALRNKQKTLDKIIDTEKGIKKGEIQPTDAQKEMIGRKDALKAEMKEIKDLIDLYIQANPDYKRKGIEEKKETPVVVTPTTANVEQAFTLLSKVLLLNQFNSKHGGVISQSGSELDSLTILANRFGQLHSAVSDLDLTRFETESKNFASAFTALSARSSEKLCSKQDALTFAGLHDFVEREVQNIPAHIAEIHNSIVNHQEEEHAKPTEPEVTEEVEHTTEAVQEEEIETQNVDEEEKVNAVTEETKPEEGNDRIQQRGEGGRGRGGRGGDRRGGRGNGEWRGGDRPQTQGENRYRGGYHKGPREDKDGFIVEGEKNERRGGRGRGGYNGDRSGRGDRGERGGERGSYRGRGDRRGGNRPREEGTTQPAEQQQQTQ